jgi:hypothetical protein
VVRRIMNVVAAVAVGAVTFLGVATPAAHAAATIHGCPAGYACIYPQNAGWNGDRPSHKYYTYGEYNLSNQFGTHRVLNNQTGDWAESAFYYCTGYNGGGTCGRVQQGAWEDLNLTPINSVVLCCRQPWS